MNFSNLDFDYLLTNGLKFSLDILKTNVKKAVSDNAVKVVKNIVLGKNSAKNVKNNNIRLKAGDSVTFVVTKQGLESLIENGQDNDKLLTRATSVDTLPWMRRCSHPKSTDDAILCDICVNNIKSKL